MENIIFEDPSRRIVYQKRVKSSLPLKKDTSDLPTFHEQRSARPYPPRDQLEMGESGSMTFLSAFSSYCDCLRLVLTAPIAVGERTDSYSHGHGHSSSHVSPNRQADISGPVSLHDLFTLAGDDDLHSTDDDNNGFADDIFTHPSENEPLSGSITSAGASPDNSDAPIRDVTVRLEEQATFQSSPKPQVKSDRHRSKQRRRPLFKASSVISDSDELESDFEESKSGAETDLDKVSGDRWEYIRIVARRIDSSGRRMAKVRWKDTWEPEGELSGLETALLLDAKRKRREEQSSKEICLKCGARKRKNFA
jgi:hypothetical protein